jgi:hypothetical protein
LDISEAVWFEAALKPKPFKNTCIQVIKYGGVLMKDPVGNLDFVKWATITIA